MQGAEDKMDEGLISYYGEEWDRYATGVSYCNRLFTYLNRHWVKAERAKGNTSVHTIDKVRLGIGAVISEKYGSDTALL